MDKVATIMIENFGTIVCLASVLMALALTAHAVPTIPTSEVIFVKGSDCGLYQGDLTSGRLFMLEMKANQELVVKTEGHVQSMVDSKGNVLKDQGGSNYRYMSQHSGTHTIKMVGRNMNRVEFCVF